MSLSETPNCPSCGITVAVEDTDDNLARDVESIYANRLKGTSLDCDRCGSSFECYYF